jgi:hypothetical protein
MGKAHDHKITHRPQPKTNRLGGFFYAVMLIDTKTLKRLLLINLPPMVLLFGLIVAITVYAEVYKWIDDEGKVHYGDHPPVSSGSNRIQIAPPPSDQTIKETQDRLERLREYKNKLRDSRKEEKTQAVKPVVSTVNDFECFTSLEDSWGEIIQDTREEVQRRPLADSELRQLDRLFNALKGSWKGEMKETNCVQPDATPPSEVYHYKIRLEARLKADHLFEIDAELEGEESDADLRRRSFWIFLSGDGLRYWRSASNIMPELDKPRYDVETITIGNDSITFYMRRGGALRQTIVFYLHKFGRSFAIKELFYVQGALARKHSWMIGR